MHAQLVPMQFKAGQIDNFLSVYNEQVIPIYAEASGFKCDFVVSDAATDNGFMLSLWDSENALTTMQSASRDPIASHLAPFLRELPQAEDLSVMVNAGHQTGAVFARVITLPVPEKHIAAARTVYEQEYLPLLQQQPGFLGVMWLVNTERGTGWGISYWESHAQMQAADQDGEFFPKVLARLACYFSAPPVMGYYAVNVLR